MGSEPAKLNVGEKEASYDLEVKDKTNQGERVKESLRELHQGAIQACPGAV